MIEYKDLRDKEFFEACKKAISESTGHIHLSQIVERVILSPASSFFLSERQYGRIVRAKSTNVPRSKAGAELFYEIRRRYRQIKLNYPNMHAETIAKNFIAYQAAPRFYISVARGLIIYYSFLKKKKKHGNKNRTN
jgi:hypothetical protein